MDQLETLKQLFAEARSDGHDLGDLSPLEMLDYMAILGVAFVESANATLAYQDAIRAWPDNA